MSPLPLVSVIVPIYQTEEFLEECLNSILNQDYSNMEILCVDDASPDNSKLILKDFKKRDKRVQVITHKQNKGLGASRNTGIYHSNGEYIAGVDSDDFIQPDMISALIKCQQSHDADIAVCGINSLFDDQTISPRFKPAFTSQDISISTTNIFRLTNPSFWNKLWRKSLFTENNIKFPDRLYFEDLATTPKLFAASSKIAATEAYLYNYRIREGSITNSPSPRHIHDYFEIFHDLQLYLVENDLWSYQSNYFYEEIDLALQFFSRCVVQSKYDDLNKTSLLRQAYLMRAAYLQQGTALLGKDLDNLIELFK